MCCRYIPYRPTGAVDGPTKLFCAVTDEFALGSALLYGKSNGAFLDATWRGMNQNYAPTTFLLGVDDKNHATPCKLLVFFNKMESNFQLQLLFCSVKMFRQTQCPCF